MNKSPLPAAKTHLIQNFKQRKKQSLDDMLFYTNDYESLADYWIFNSFKTHLHSPGLNHSKRSIGKVRIKPTEEYLFLFIEKQRWLF